MPLFPGNNELDQINKIYNVLGMPSNALLEKFNKHNNHLDYKNVFLTDVCETSISPLLPNASPECKDLISKLLVYDPDERLTAEQALNCSYFNDLREQDSKIHHMISNNSNGVELEIKKHERIVRKIKRLKIFCNKYLKPQNDNKANHYMPKEEQKETKIVSF